MWGLPRQPPSSLPHCKSPWELRGRGEAPHMHPKGCSGIGMGCVLLGLRCTLCTPSQHCQEGMPRAQRMGQHGDSTHNCRHVVLCPRSAAGHWQREGGISLDPSGLRGPPLCSIPCPSCSGGGRSVQRTPLTLLSSITYCPHVCLPVEAEQPGETPGMFAKAV